MAIAPIPPSTRKLNATSDIVCGFIVPLEIALSGRASKTPAMPPRAAMAALSSIIENRIARRVKPMARSVASSRPRDATVENIVFIVPKIAAPAMKNVTIATSFLIPSRPRV